MMTGFTKSTPKSEQIKNEIQAVRTFLKVQPYNRYWQNRLIALTIEAEAMDIINWMEADDRDWQDQITELRGGL